MQKIGNRIKLLRGKLTQTKFAQKLGMSMKTIQNWEAGKIEPGDGKLIHISHIFNCNLDWLIKGEGEMYIDGKGQLQEWGDEEIEQADEPMEWFRDKDIFDRWIMEENAIILYCLKRAEINILSKLNIKDLPGHEDNYGRIYRAMLTAIRQGDCEIRKRRSEIKEERKKSEERKLVKEAV